jgi:hypothetical protein
MHITSTDTCIWASLRKHNTTGLIAHLLQHESRISHDLPHSCVGCHCSSQAIRLPLPVVAYQPTTPLFPPTGPATGYIAFPPWIACPHTDFFFFFFMLLCLYGLSARPSSHHTCVTTAHITPHQHAPLCPPCHHSRSTWAVMTS